MAELVLNVDDLPEQRYLRTRILRAAGFEVIEAAAGNAALALARDRHPALVVLDIHLPDLDGRDVCRQLKTDPSTSDILVLHVSATLHDPAARAAALNAGADGYLTEAVEPEEFVAHVRALLRLAAAETEARRAQRALAESEERLRLAQEAGGVGTFDWNLATGEIVWSPEFERIYGIAAPPDPRARLDAVLGLIHPGDRESVNGGLREWLESGSAELTRDYRIIRHDGEQRWVAARARALRDEAGRPQRVIGTTIDITERKELEQRLQRKRAQLEAVYQAMNDGVAVFDVAGEIVMVNDAVARRCGYASAAALPPQMRLGDLPFVFRDLQGEVVPPEQWPAARVARGEVLTHWELRASHVKTGQEWIFSYSGRPVYDAEGRVVLAVVVSSDITERKAAEAALGRAHAELEEADRRKDEFLAVLSHELRNPLAPIRFALPLLQVQTLNPAGARAAAVVQRQVEHLTRLVDDLLDVSRIAKGKLELRPEHVTLSSVVKTAAEAAAPRMAAADHRLTLLVPDEPIWLYGDPSRLAQVVTNLLVNSAKYSLPGGEVVVAAAVEDGQAVIRVRDAGIGIPREALPFVFDMFQQVHRRDDVSGGLGIGLALVKRLVEMHGGTVHAHSEGVGRGAEFVVRLPLGEEGRLEDAAREPPARRVERRLRVLVVDDNADLVEMLTMLVESAGHDARRASDGRSAIAVARSCRPDVVLLDLGLPDMTGLEVAAALREIPQLAGIRIAALTGWSQPDDRRQTTAAGFDYHLTKPADPEELERLLADVAAAV